MLTTNNAPAPVGETIFVDVADVKETEVIAEAGSLPLPKRLGKNVELGYQIPEILPIIALESVDKQAISVSSTLTPLGEKEMVGCSHQSTELDCRCHLDGQQ